MIGCVLLPRRQIPWVGTFLPFLPKDNQTWQAEDVINTINDDLARLLSLPASDFWAVVRSNDSLRICLDTYLRYKRRAYDEFREDVEGTSSASQQLARRVFMTLLRMVTPRDRDPGGPPPEQQAALLYDSWTLDVPKLMDIAVLYGGQNRELVRRFMGQLLSLQPRYRDDLAAAAPLLAANLAEVVGRCGAAGDRALRGGAEQLAAAARELGGPSGSGSGAGPSGSGSRPAAVMDPRRASLISGIKELLPDYGDGFLAACLDAYGDDSEKVVNALLEGSLLPQLSKLDPQLATWTPQQYR
ncbi:hypothetical protein GPECTOR_22g804 [Gonium pectorale]|uniref:CUE domain-containing protein n=1 Tax=Gonium pectorale TaxID=33097 RepID=A0A150GHE4_GONPE|nr:hypothetical protein GPECTOR_22g804 [Gonium pectorale]|eukprot:KXZ49213.1 hypothetical protein GPECTOR_22g804 [Gonium pectorale]